MYFCFISSVTYNQQKLAPDQTFLYDMIEWMFH